MVETLAASLAMVGAFCFALSAVFMKKGMVDSNVLSGVLINISSSTIFLLLLLPLYFHSISFDLMAILFFSAGGVSGTTLGRAFVYKGVREIGAPIATSLANLTPIIASTVGFAVLSEIPSFQKISALRWPSEELPLLHPLQAQVDGGRGPLFFHSWVPCSSACPLYLGRQV